MRPARPAGNRGFRRAPTENSASSRTRAGRVRRYAPGMRVLLLFLIGAATATFAQMPDGGLHGRTREEMRRESPVPHTEVVPATVVGLSVRTNGWWIVTLDNGQIWSQIENRPTAAVAIGDDVTLRHSRAGSYVLTTIEGIETRVRRER